MFRKLLPRKDAFFRYMEASADKAIEIVAAFQELLDHLDDAKSRLDRVKQVEHEGDEILHRTLAELHRSFVTPLDRNEISKICKRLDDIIDMVEGAAQRIYHYDLREARQPLRALVDILAKQVFLVRQVVGGLDDMKHAKPLREALIEINTLENEADEVLRPSIGALFRDETDCRNIIKWKEIYEHLEKATDRCEDIADHIENVLLEYA